MLKTYGVVRWVGWGGVVGWVAHKILVLAQGPLVLCFGVWGQGLTKELGLEPDQGIVSELESMTNDRTYGVEPEDMV